LTSTTTKLKQLKSYSEELGLDLNKVNGRFEWFIASVLFAKRISTDISKKTFNRLRQENLTTPQALLEAGWDTLVEVLDSGGYVRYDFSTASTLLKIAADLTERYGDLDCIHARAESPRQLERMLMEFKGVGPVGVSIFLREMRGIWDKANPAPSPLAVQIAQKLNSTRIKDVESQLVRLHLEYCKKHACNFCPVQSVCLVSREKGLH